MSDLSALGKKLSFLSSNDPFSNPFDDEPTSVIQPITTKSSKKDNENKEKPKKKKKDKFARLMSESNSFLDQYSSDLIDEFDEYIETGFLEDEDVTLRNSLVGMGRKYARDTKSTAETSELTKAFSANEKILSQLLDEIKDDKSRIQKDIDSMRVMRTKNYKTLAELVETKSTYQNTALSIVKELNNIKKTQFDLQLKMKKNKEDEGDGLGSTNKAIQQLFSIGRGNIMSSLGGYEGVSGANDYSIDGDTEYVSSISSGYDDDLIQKKYFNDDSESEGDKFLKYEGMGVEYILLIDEDDNKQIIAEDRDGNIIPDYPTPKNIDELTFDINESIGTATDNLYRNYKLRRI